MSEEYIQISAFLRPEQIKALDELARIKGIHGRQPFLRWAVDAFLLAESSTYRTQPQIEATPAETANA
jgi:hypothetical protein